jgi:site-specific recombinase XerD
MPSVVAFPGARAQTRFFEFFAAQIRNKHTRRAYATAAREFLAWCESARVASIVDVKPLHVAAYIEQLGRERSAPTVKQRLAAIRHLFDWLVTGQVMPVNPAASVSGPSHSVKRGKTPVLDPAEARALLDSIDLVASAASGGPDAVLDLQTKARAETLIGTRQRIHAGRMLSDYPSGPPDLRPDEARDARGTAEQVVRAVLDWLGKSRRPATS